MKKLEAAIIDIDRVKITVTVAGTDGGRAAVRSCRSYIRPAEVDFLDGVAVGSWVREKLREAGVSGMRIVLSLPRGEVVIKRLSLPGGEGISNDDLVGAVRLQMARQLSVPVESSAIDYVPVAADTLEATASGSAGQTVNAAALPGDQMDWCRGVARAAGIKLSRIGLRCLGAACVLADESLRRDGAVLGVVPTGASVEFVIVEAGHLMLARAVDIAWPGGDEPAELEAYAEKVAVEAKRTWMSHRAGRGETEAQAVIVLGSGPGAQKLSERCGAAMERPGVTLAPPGATAVKSEGEPALSVAMAAVGLIQEELAGRPSLDFLHPRRAPDRAARRRQMMLLGALAAIVGLGTPIVLAKLELSSLDGALARQRQVTATRQGELMEMWAEHARLKHMEQWASVKVDWMAHLGALSEQVPAPPEALIDDLGGTLNSSVDFTGKSGQYAGGTWSFAQTASFTLAGRVKQRETAASLRGRLAAGEIYSVESPTPDTGDRFSFELFTPLAKPVKPAPKVEPKKAEKGEGEPAGAHDGAGKQPKAPSAGTGKAPAKDGKPAVEPGGAAPAKGGEP